MSHVFISYARADEAAARAIAQGLRALGHGVWRDDELPAHRDYSEVIEERLRAAPAVVVVWTAQAVKSQWVRAEADLAREAGTLVQLTLDGAPLPLPFNRIQCADLAGWAGDPAAPGWRKVAASVAELAGRPAPAPGPSAAPPAAAPAPRPPAATDKPAIAVLPFAELSGAAGQDFFAEGVAAEIVAALSRFRSLFVIASGSSLAYRDRARGLKEIAAELGVRYLVDGQVQRSGQRVRIAARLVDAADGAQVWTGRFDGVLEDVFALQDEVALAIASQIEPNVAEAELQRGQRRPLADLTAYDLYLRARQLYARGGTAAGTEAWGLVEQAIARDPGFAPAHGLAAALAGLASLAPGPDREARRAISREAGRRALTLAPDDAEVLAFISAIFVLMGEPLHTVESMAARALALNPGSAISWFASGGVRLCAGDSETALAHFDAALRLDPRSVWRPQIRLFQGDCLYMLRRFDEAIAAFADMLQVLPDHPGAHLMSAASHAQAGHPDAARAHFQRVPPGWVEVAVGFFHKAEDRELLREGLRLAGAGV